MGSGAFRFVVIVHFWNSLKVINCDAFFTLNLYTMYLIVNVYGYVYNYMHIYVMHVCCFTYTYCSILGRVWIHYQETISA